MANQAVARNHPRANRQVAPIILVLLSAVRICRPSNCHRRHNDPGHNAEFHTSLIHRKLSFHEVRPVRKHEPIILTKLLPLSNRRCPQHNVHVSAGEEDLHPARLMYKRGPASTNNLLPTKPSGQTNRERHQSNRCNFFAPLGS